MGDGAGSNLQRALDKVIDEAKDGLRHGFFDMTLNSEIINGKKRRLTIKAGKSHVFTIGEEEILLDQR